jgi:DNA-binding Xre family transcriptional regulator
MIRARIREIAETNGVSNAYQLGLRIGVAPNVSSRLWKDDFTQIGKVTLDKLCTAMNCQVGDLLVYEAGPKKGRRKTDAIGSKSGRVQAPTT